MAPLYTVIVGNIGTVYDGPTEHVAREIYTDYVAMSKALYGRACGEPVTLFYDDDIIQEHAPGTED